MDNGHRTEAREATRPAGENVAPSTEDAALPLAAALDARADALRVWEDELRTREMRLHTAAEHAREIQQHYLQLFELSREGYLVTDPTATILESNCAAAALVGIGRKHLVDKPLSFLLAPECRRDFYTRFNQLRHGRAPMLTWQSRLHSHRMPSRDVEITAMPWSAVDRDIGYSWLIRDISLQKVAEREASAERFLVSQVMDAAQILIFVVDWRGHILRSNRFACDLLGLSNEALDGMSWADLIESDAARGEALAMMNELTQHGTAPAGIWTLRAAHGARRVVAFSARATVITDGKPALLLFGYDITELQEAQQQVLQTERLAAIGLMVAGLAHETRNALQRGQACLDRLRWRVEDRPEALDLVDRALEAQNDLARLYEDLRLYAAPIQLREENCRLAETWRQAWDMARQQHADKAAQLDEAEGAETGYCRVDRFRMVQVFRNLMDNALAAAPGPAHLRIRTEDTVLNGRPAVRVRLRDAGPGMTPEQQERAFQPFFTTKLRGTGLGLAIARRIVEAHGGEIALTHSSADGTEFQITLPRSAT